MKNIRTLFFNLMLSAFLVCSFSSCEDAVEPEPTVTPGEPEPEPEPKPDPEKPGQGGTGETPYTSIPDELVGTWYAEDNPNPMTTNWEKGTFQGAPGLKEYRTMVFTKDGKNAIEFTSEVYTTSDEVKQVMFKRVGTLEYKKNPNSLTFHVQSGKVRYFSSKFAGYQEADLNPAQWSTYSSVLVNPEATTYSNATNYLSAKRAEGHSQYSVKYTKADGNNTGGGSTNPDDLYAKPPTSGTYIKIADKYYPTVTIGSQEWMAVNLAGNGGMKDSNKPHYGTFFKFMDLKNIPVPAGWRIPTKQDYIKLLQSQGLELTPWEATEGESVESKKKIGQLMATTGWLKQDGYATNKSGFNAFPANYKAQDAAPHGEGTRCLLWTSDVNTSDNPIVFQIIQLTGETYANFNPFPISYVPQHLPVRLVRNK